MKDGNKTRAFANLLTGVGVLPMILLGLSAALMFGTAASIRPTFGHYLGVGETLTLGPALGV